MNASKPIAASETLDRRKQIAARMRMAREFAGISQKDLAEWMPIDQANVSRWEHGGTVTLTNLMRYADGVGVRVESLFKGIS